MLPNTIYAMWWTCDWAGDVQVDTMIAASIHRGSKRFAREGKSTYDGRSIRTQGSFVVRRHSKPSFVRALEREYGDRVVFGLCRDGYNIGCWVDGEPYRYDDIALAWTWRDSEWKYLLALVLARTGKCT